MTLDALFRIVDTRVPVASPDVAEAAQKLGVTIKTCNALPPNTLVLVDWDAARRALNEIRLSDAARHKTTFKP